MRIYVICQVRGATASEMKWLDSYVASLEVEGNEVFYPPRDAKQDSETGFEIIVAEREAISKCDKVHVFWDPFSYGSHFDLGMAFALNKPIRFIQLFCVDYSGKSYLKAIKKWMDQR